MGEACQRKCMLEPMCEAVTVLGPDIDKLYSCHLLAAVQLDTCRSTGTRRTTPRAGAVTLVRRPWALLREFDCRGADIEHPPGSSCGVMDVFECQRRCDATMGCAAVTWAPNVTGSGYGHCYRRANVVLTGCERNADVDTYISSRNDSED